MIHTSYQTHGYDHNNIFAQIVQNKIPADYVHKHPLTICFKNIAPLAPVHLLLVPTGPYTDIQSFGTHASDEELRAFLEGLALVTQNISSYSIASNTAQGPITHQEIYHFHLHITSPPLVRIATPPIEAQIIRYCETETKVYFDPNGQRLWFGRPDGPWLPQHVRLIAHLVNSYLTIHHGFNIQGQNGIWRMDWS
jgi:diadenosine tetraphosphate (Ap4A) HIT family hydrolase